jgi:hypothetical protein
LPTPIHGMLLGVVATEAANEVRYQPNGDNTVLRMAIYRSWKSKCWFCTTPTDFRDIQIDHLIPRASGLNNEVKADYDLPEDFDVDDPMNLAPICGNCNRDKGTRHLQVPRLGLKLEQAAEKRAGIIREVANFRLSREVGPALLKLAQADLSSTSSKELFMQWAPTITQRLAGIDESLAEFTSQREMGPVDIGGDVEPLMPSVRLREAGRAAVLMLEDAAGVNLQAVFEELLRAVADDACELAEGRISSLSDADPGPGVLTYIDLEAEIVGLELRGTSITVGVRIDFRLAMTASIICDADDGEGFVDRQGETYGGGSYTASVWADSSQTALYEIQDLFLENETFDTWTE